MRIKIGAKLIGGFMLVVLLMCALALYLMNKSQQSLEESVGKSCVFLAGEMLKRIDQEIYLKIEELQSHCRHELLHKSVSESNREFEKLDNIEEYINKKDREWVSAQKDEITPFMQELITSDLSNHLRGDLIKFHHKKYGYKTIVELFVTNRYGANVSQSGKTSDYRQDDEEWWQIAREKDHYISGVEYDESAATSAMCIALRIDDEEENFIGVMKAVIAVKSIIRSAEIAVKKYETTRIKLITKDGRLIYRTRVFKFLEDVSDKTFFKQLKGEKGFFIAKAGGRERLYSYARSKGYREFEGMGWIIVVGHDVQEILKPVFKLRNRMVVASLILIAIGILIAFAMARSITKPIAELSKGAEIIGKGDLEHRVEIRTKDEIGELASAFNQMTAHLQQTEDELRESEERFRTVADFTYDWEYWLGTDGNYIYISPSCERITGYPYNEFMKDPDLINKIIHPDDLGTVANHFHKEELTSQTPLAIDFRIVGRDGKERWIGHVCQPVYAKDGSLLGRRGSNRDITERKRAEEELRRMNIQLENANKELEAFSYSVSHDLRAPLRSVDGFSQILLEDYSDILDEKGKHYLERARAGTQNMGQLIDDILNLSRIGRQAMKMKKINLESIAREVYNSLEDEWKGRKVDFNVHKCPPAAADLNLIKIVFMNLLSNALKFTGNRKEAKIEVGSETKDEQTVFFVKDNGVGFDMKYVDKLFTPFQRLHSVEEYEGTGIGLAIVQRIIHRHGGSDMGRIQGGKGNNVLFYFDCLDSHQGTKTQRINLPAKGG